MSNPGQTFGCKKDFVRNLDSSFYSFQVNRLTYLIFFLSWFCNSRSKTSLKSSPPYILYTSIQTDFILFFRIFQWSDNFFFDQLKQIPLYVL